MGFPRHRLSPFFVVIYVPSAFLGGLGCVDPVAPAVESDPSVSVLAAWSCESPGRRGGDFGEGTLLAHPPQTVDYMWGGAVAVADLDKDGSLDLVVQHEEGARRYEGDAGTILDGATALGEANTSFGFSAVPADIDGDGQLDLYLSRLGRPDRLYLNRGGTFIDETLMSGISRDALFSSAVSFGDIDGDEDLDLFVGGFGPALGGVPEDFPPASPAKLYRNDGTGTFEDISDRLPVVAHEGYTLAGGLHDLDRDGDLDLTLVNDWGLQLTPNVALFNDGQGNFSVADDRGLGVGLAGMGLGIADINGDQRPDLLIPDWGGVVLLESVGEQDWFDVAEARGLNADIPSDHVAWGGRFVDMDLDGDLDALVSMGHILSKVDLENPVRQEDRVYLQEGATFIEVSAERGLDHDWVSRGMAVADLNRDGWPDLIKTGLRRGTGVFLAECGEGTALEVTLRQNGPNPFAIGARVAVLLPDGRRLERVMRAGGFGYGAGEPPEVHVGLDGAAEVSVEVTWPDGDVTRYSVGANQFVQIDR